MIYSNNLPDRPGFYWFKFSCFNDVVIQITRDHNGKLYLYWGGNVYDLADLKDIKYFEDALFCFIKKPKVKA